MALAARFSPMPGIGLQSVVARSTDVLASRVDEGLVMMDIESGMYFGLADTANVIWDHLEEPISVDDLCSLLASKYSINRQVCEQDILEFLDKLMENRLLRLA